MAKRRTAFLSPIPDKNPRMHCLRCIMIMARRSTNCFVGTNSCWWNGSNLAQYPVVQGSTWVVDQGGDAAHNQYGLDTVGYGYATVNRIQTQGAAHGVEFPCAVTIYQSMNYAGIDLYVTNLLTQTIGSNTVTVCRAGVCSGTIQY